MTKLLLRTTTLLATMLFAGHALAVLNGPYSGAFCQPEYYGSGSNNDKIYTYQGGVLNSSTTSTMSVICPIKRVTTSGNVWVGIDVRRSATYASAIFSCSLKVYSPQGVLKKSKSMAFNGTGAGFLGGVITNVGPYDSMAVRCYVPQFSKVLDYLVSEW